MDGRLVFVLVPVSADLIDGVRGHARLRRDNATGHARVISSRIQTTGSVGSNGGMGYH